MGLSPSVLQDLLENSKTETEELIQGKGKGDAEDPDLDNSDSPATAHTPKRHPFPRVVYEVTGESGRIEPQLRLWVEQPHSPPESSGSTSRLEESGSGSDLEADIDLDEGLDRDGLGGAHMSLLWALQRRSWLAATVDDPEKSVVEPSSARIVEVTSR